MSLFTKNAYIPQFAGSVFGFSHFIASCNPEIVLKFMKLKGRYTFVVSVVLLLVGIEKKTW